MVKPVAEKETRKFRSVAVPLEVWADLWNMAQTDHRSPAQQIAFLVSLAKDFPSNKEVLEFYAEIHKEQDAIVDNVSFM